MGNSLTEKRDGSIIPVNPHPSQEATNVTFSRGSGGWGGGYPTCMDRGLKRRLLSPRPALQTPSMDSELFTCRKPAVVPPSPAPARQRGALSSAEHNAFCVYRHVLLTKQLVPITALFGPR